MKKKQFPSSQHGKTLAAISGASVAFLAAGTAHAVSNVQVKYSDVDATATAGNLVMLALTTQGNLVAKSFANKAALNAFINTTHTAAFSVNGGDAAGIYFLLTATTFHDGLGVQGADGAVMVGGFGNAFVRSLAYRDVISAGQPPWGSNGFFTITGVTFGAEWGTTGYLGFRINVDGGDTYYAWAYVSDIVTGTSVTIDSYGVRILANTKIGAGQWDHSTPTAAATPEPATAGLALLALGAAGVMRHKRKRAAVQAEA